MFWCIACPCPRSNQSVIWFYTLKVEYQTVVSYPPYVFLNQTPINLLNLFILYNLTESLLYEFKINNTYVYFFFGTVLLSIGSSNETFNLFLPKISINIVYKSWKARIIPINYQIKLFERNKHEILKLTIKYIFCVPVDICIY